MSKTAVGLFENAAAADLVAKDLGAGDFPRMKIQILKEPLGMAVTGVTSIPRTDFQVALGRELEAMGASEGEANAYVQQVRLGGVLVFATGSSEEVDHAAGIMNRHCATKVEELIGREPGSGTAAAGSLPLSRDANPNPFDSTQTGRIRQSGDGVRLFVW